MKGTKDLELDFGELVDGSDPASDARKDRGRDKALRGQSVPGHTVHRCKSVRVSKILDPEPNA